MSGILASKLLKSFVRSAFGSYVNPAMGALSILSNYKRSRDRSSAQFHQRMQDMESYGIHPLAAIGGSGMSGLGQGAVQTSDMVGGAAQRAVENRQKREAAREQKRYEKRIDRHRKEDKAHDIELINQRAVVNQNHGGNPMLQPVANLIGNMNPLWSLAGGAASNLWDRFTNHETPFDLGDWRRPIREFELEANTRYNPKLPWIE